MGAIAHSGALGGEVQDASPASLTFLQHYLPFLDENVTPNHKVR